MKLQLPLADGLVHKGAFFPDSRVAEPTGYIFEKRLELLFTIAPVAGAAADDEADSGVRGHQGCKADLKKSVKLSEDDLETDWYALMKLEHCEASTEDDIKTAYRRACLDTHPDKQPNHSDVLFKKVTRGFEILGSADLRRAYDSSRPFDDTIPGDDVKEAEFYSTFAPVFDRNMKWSAVPHPPHLGDDDMDIKQINRFYDFWMTFRTWRDFSHEVEMEDIDEKMSREEKRHYQRENQRQVEKLRRAEGKRVRTLVERAKELDPRLRRIRDAAQAKKDKERADLEAERAKLREEKARKQNEKIEAEKKAETEKKALMVDSKAVVGNCFKEVREFFKSNDLVCDMETNMILPALVRMPNIKWMFKNCKAEDATYYRDAVVGAGPEGAVAIFNELIVEREKMLGCTRYGENIKKVAPARYA